MIPVERSVRQAPARGAPRLRQARAVRPAQRSDSGPPAAAGLEGYFIRTATWLERALFLSASLLLIHPGLVTDLIGAGLLLAAFGSQRMRPAEVPAPRRVPS